MYFIGLDVGSVSINAVVIDSHGHIVHEEPYRRHFGLVNEDVATTLQGVLERFATNEIGGICFTGIQGQRVASVVGAPFEVETIAQVAGALHIAPSTRSIISMGGQDASLFQIGHNGDGSWYLDAFHMNGPCASGTGSFIDQQAERLACALYGDDFQLSHERLDSLLQDFINLGQQSTSPAAVACRCTVFTKSDMIHLQNKGESLSNIIAGLHSGNAANYMSTIVANREVLSPVIFIGGMASNALQVEAFRRYFPDLQVPLHHTSLGALGAALRVRNRGDGTAGIDMDALRQNHQHSSDFPRTAPLELRYTHFETDNSLKPFAPDKPVRAFLGIDIGSTSTKYALIDEQGTLIGKCYRPTQGKPIEVSQKLLRHMLEHSGPQVELLGIATTGSGRNVVGDFVSADLILDEITAHATGAVAVDPSIDTIFEIGGQDSKYIAIDGAYPVDFVMNKVCAAGTGSFIHELANKMKINIFGEFQEIALSSPAPVHLAERCTVFMESDMAGYAQKGAGRDELIAGLCYAIVHNYLHRVVENRPIGKKVMFLGGPSLNKGIVAAFERVLDRPVLVPKHREVMGAFGAALTLMRSSRNQGLSVRQRDLSQLCEATVEARESICRAEKDCHNECKLKIYQFGQRKSIWGGDCGRFEVSHHEGRAASNYFLERQQLFREYLERQPVIFATPSLSRQPGTVGLPASLHVLDWGIFWTHFLSGLGLQVVLTPPTNGALALLGTESMTAETCYPVKVFHGHVAALVDQVEWLFLPNVINVPIAESDERGYLCPLVESSHFMTKAALRLKEQQVISPTVHLKDGVQLVTEALWEGFPAVLRADRKTFRRAVESAWQVQQEFTRAIRQRGEEILRDADPDEPLWVVTGRPYNLYDEGLNLQIGKHLSKLGIAALPMDFLHLDGEDLSDFPGMYWGLGGRILKTAKAIARHPNWFGLHISNFSCGADSFLEHFYQHILQEKPSLMLELDEHSGVAGTLTRVEAFRNVVNNIMMRQRATTSG
ncbi:CoA-substrate-specific enzyme activase [Desulfurispirillum indicum S5]|uniref:CoA-substrate-specific enzyme activase n=1 Tax=Desulfurispirillum indicum (strain ATCC BAA-1389 / DSM 22839 / S5) TaxID=653733 RepID=E6W1N6_DESIS|nr:acyl-CoA dehydratase activase [Desulfurispirillum indicum]ADU66585.1 CoA-substrate-specific enzyme activase [Desulfurispirillum indicum S5]